MRAAAFSTARRRRPPRRPRRSWLSARASHRHSPAGDCTPQRGKPCGGRRDLRGTRGQPADFRPAAAGTRTDTARAGRDPRRARSTHAGAAARAGAGGGLARALARARAARRAGRLRQRLCTLHKPAAPRLPPGRGRAALAQQRLGYADVLLKRALTAQPRDVAALRLSAEVAAARDDYPHASTCSGSACGLRPATAVRDWSWCGSCTRSRKPPPCCRCSSDCGGRAASLQYRTLEASAHSILGQNERAAQIVADLLALYPDNEWAWLHYGHVLRSAGRLEEAVAAYRRSIELKPEFGEAWFSLANLKTLRFSAADDLAMRQQLARPDLPRASACSSSLPWGKRSRTRRTTRKPSSTTRVATNSGTPRCATTRKQHQPGAAYPAAVRYAVPRGAYGLGRPSRRSDLHRRVAALGLDAA